MKTIDGTKELPQAYWTDPFPNDHGVLLSDEIEEYTKRSVLISSKHFIDETIKDPYVQKNIEPASYDLRLGSRCFVAGKGICGYQNLSDDDEKRYLVIPPHGMAIISTYECLVMPRYIIGRWNLRIGLVYQGLLWGGGPQVDPGFVGPLHCTLFNMSNKNVTLEFKDHVVTIDFVKTTPRDVLGKSKPFYEDEKEIKIKEITDYVKDPYIESAVAAIGHQAEEAQRRVMEMSTPVFAVLSIIVAALALVVTLPFYSEAIKTYLPPSLTMLTLASLSVSFFALVFSYIAYRLKKAESKQVRPKPKDP